MTMRRLLAIAGITAMTALVGAGIVAAPAGAQAQAQVFTCTFSVSATDLAAGGGPVQVSGFAPADTKVHVLVNGVEQATAQSSKTDGAWGPVTVTITTTSDVRVTIEQDYPATPCIGPGGTDVQRVTVAGTKALATTGSNNTTTYVLVGVVLLVTGLALAIAARRREYTHGRV
jgi:LPXTG-motif cell wall-anchored protein